MNNEEINVTEVQSTEFQNKATPRDNSLFFAWISLFAIALMPLAGFCCSGYTFYLAKKRDNTESMIISSIGLIASTVMVIAEVFYVL